MKLLNTLKHTRDVARALAIESINKASNSWVRKPKRLECVLADKQNDDWEWSNRGARLSFVKSPIIRSSDKVFAMGSCFAREVRHVLRDLDFDVYPKYNDIQFDPETQKFQKLARREHVNHYNTFSIRQEFEMAFSGKSYQISDFVNRALHVPSEIDLQRNWQDPYRRSVYGTDENAMFDLSKKIGDCIRDGIMKSDAYLMTLGLTEVWRNESNGLYANQIPAIMVDGKVPGYAFECSTYEQNYANMHAVCSMIQKHFPKRKVIVTVSPVALGKTFSGRDIVVANTESKSILRAVAASISHEFENVTYWPSYEIALVEDFFEEDGRHVTRQGVERILSQFLSTHLEKSNGHALS